MSYKVYLLDWTHLGGLKYVGCSSNLKHRIRWNHYSKLVVKAFELGSPKVQILHVISDKVIASYLEIAEIKKQKTLHPLGYNKELKGLAKVKPDWYRYSP